MNDLQSLQIGAVNPDLAQKTHYGGRVPQNIEKAIKNFRIWIKKIGFEIDIKNDPMVVHMEKKGATFPNYNVCNYMLENLIVSLTLEMWTQSASRFFSSVYVFHALRSS